MWSTAGVRGALTAFFVAKLYDISVADICQEALADFPCRTLPGLTGFPVCTASRRNRRIKSGRAPGATGTGTLDTTPVGAKDYFVTRIVATGMAAENIARIRAVQINIACRSVGGMVVRSKVG